MSSDQDDDQFLERLADEILEGEAPVAQGSQEETPSRLAARRQADILAQIAAVHRASAAESPTVDSPSDAPRTWGRLAILEELGRGAFGAVYRARDPRLDRDVALKLFAAGDRDGEGLVSAVVDEGRLLARVHHPNVVAIYDANVVDGRAGLTMELVRGQTLEQALGANGPFSSDAVRTIGLEIARALFAVHEAGLLHRDVKAQNVMRRADGRFVLMDFGASRRLDRTRHDDAAITGTPLYLAPEILEQGNATVQSDIYALGVLLFHLLTATYPVTGQTLRELRDAHREGRRQSLRVARGDLDARLADVIERALAADPQKRYANAADMAEALASAEAGRLRQSGRFTWLTIATVVTIVSLAAAWVWTRKSTRRNDALTAVQIVIPDVAFLGQLSRDGRYVPYSDVDGRRLMLYDFSSGTQTMLVDRPAKESGFIEYAVMSPDGRSVAYSWDTGTARELRVAHVRDKNSPPRVLLRDETPNSGDDPGRGLMPTDWFPDGSAILVFRAREDGTSDIARVSTRDGTVTTLKRGLDSILSMNLSHDGRYVAYDRSIPGDNDARDLFLVSVDTGQEVSLVRDPAHDAVPLWTPDDRGVLFTSDRSGSYGLWLAPVSRGLPTGPPTIVRKDMGRIFPNSLADDGTLLYSLASGESDAYTAALGKDGTVIPDSVRRAASSFQGSNLDPEWSHDGRRLAFVSRRRTLGPRTTALVIHSQDGGDEQVLWPDLDSFTQPQWSPDGLWFVVRGRNNQGKRGPWLVNARTGAVDTRVGGPSGGPRFEDMDWAPDSRTLFIATGQTIGQFDVKSGRLEEIYRDSRKRRALGVRLSPDHTQLAITPGDETTRTLEILSLSNGMSRGVLTLSEPERFMLQEWTADGKGVLIVRGRNEGSNASTGSWSLWSVPAAGGVPRPLGLAGPSLRGVKASPDGIHIAFRMGEPTPDDWLMRNFLPTPRTP